MESIDIDSSEYLSLLKKNFDDLENCLAYRLNNNESSKKTVAIAQYEEAIGLLTVEKSNLEQQLLEKQQECCDWKGTCFDVLNKLNSAIEAIKSILNKVGGV